MVYQIAIVEDEDLEAQKLTMYFKQYSNGKDISFQITRFGNGDQFIARYKPVYDVVLMDIMMPGTNGMDTAKELRKIDSQVTLIFVTNMSQFAVHGYEVEAFDYIVKPVSYQNFSMKLDRLMNKLKNELRNSYIFLNLPDGKKRISPSQIRYIEVVRHDITYHTTEGNFTVYGSMKAAEAELNPEVFSRCNNCYLVNLNYVTAVSNDSSVFLGEEELQISRSRKKAFLEQLNEFLGGNF